jgi:hypothetical protein
MILRSPWTSSSARDWGINGRFGDIMCSYGVSGGITSSLWARLTSSDGWVFEHHKDPRHHVHNHPPSLDPAAHRQHRKVKSPVKKLVSKFSAYTSIRAREIKALIQEDFPDSNYATTDINNQRQRLRLKERDGCTASGALIKAFDEEGVIYVTKWHPQYPDIN